ncbi:MAG TPA: hypothetical protein VM118_11530 [Acidobacteriota bacterium]|nr:hypothetical protein [Acidobacteriota bacterium]
MPLLNPRFIVLRLIVILILLAFVYPFLPARQQWQIKAALGSGEADSLLREFYEPPVDGAQQFALELRFAIRSDARQIVGHRDVRYVELGDKLWGEGKQWVIHIRQDAQKRLADHLSNRPTERLWIELDRDWRAPLELVTAQSPLHIDPGLFSGEPYFPGSVLESWYPPLP